MQSIIRWAGSKRQILRKLRPYWIGEPSRYIEPFAGSACLFFALKPARGLLGDLNKELIQAYKALKFDASLVLECWRRLSPDRDSYYRIRAIDPHELSAAEAAARFLYLNRYCFNGLYRTNLKGLFNVPYGPPTKPLVNFEQNVLAAAKILSQTDLLAADFEETLSRVEPGDFVYLDPPYTVSSRRVFREYLPQAFTSQDLDRLGAWLSRLNDMGVTFLFSYADCSEARALLKPWSFKRVYARRNIAGFVGARRGAYELLASNRVLEG